MLRAKLAALEAATKPAEANPTAVEVVSPTTRVSSGKPVGEMSNAEFMAAFGTKK